MRKTRTPRRWRRHYANKLFSVEIAQQFRIMPPLEIRGEMAICHWVDLYGRRIPTMFPASTMMK